MQAEVKSENAATTAGMVLPTSLSKPFKDITITGHVLEDRCYIVRDTVLRVYLQLSGTPPLGWAFMFSSCWQALKEAKTEGCLQASGSEAKPLAGVEGDSIWVECAPEELPGRYLPTLEKCVAQANAFFRPSLQQKAMARQAKRQLDLRARTQLRELRQTLGIPAALSEPKQRGPLGRLFAAVSAARWAFKRTLKGPP